MNEKRHFWQGHAYVFLKKCYAYIRPYFPLMNHIYFYRLHLHCNPKLSDYLSDYSDYLSDYSAVIIQDARKRNERKPL